MAIDFKDPRIYTTLAGAAAGVALTRKLVPKKNLTVGKQMLGGGIGGGLGYYAGDMYMGLPPSVSDDPAKNKQSLSNYYQRNKGDVGVLDPGVLELMKGSYPELFKHKGSEAERKRRDALVGYKLRSDIQRKQGQEVASKSSLDLASKQRKGLAGNIADMGQSAFSGIVNLFK